MTNTTDQGPPQDYDTLAQLCASAASHAERASQTANTNQTSISDLRQDVAKLQGDVNIAIKQAAGLRVDMNERLGKVEGQLTSLQAGQEEILAMLNQLTRERGADD